MTELSRLPIEIIYTICTYLPDKELVKLARMNAWYGYWLSPLLGERMRHYVENEGWRIHIDVLANFNPLVDESSFFSYRFSKELLLLTEFTGIDPHTLSLEFKLCPIDNEGLDCVKDPKETDVSLVLYNNVKSNINILAYFTQISTSDKKRLRHVNQAGITAMDDRTLWNILADKHDYQGMAAICPSFRTGYTITQDLSDDMVALADGFKETYRKNTVGFPHKEYTPQSNQVHDNLEDPAIISFERVEVSPEWWIRQMDITTGVETPAYSGADFFMQLVC
ncbi:hypothetical protein BDB01DRAFT_796114 [Pilobolus umbonatus]|nr:hypothetical protein BDB01DRAFT_796114 [Pilobolus umbonatus]